MTAAYIAHDSSYMRDDPPTHEGRPRAEAPIFVQMSTGREVDSHKDALSSRHDPAGTPAIFIPRVLTHTFDDTTGGVR